MKASGFDRLARLYLPLERLSFGRTLERSRFHHFERLHGRRSILLLGDGDGRGLARACRLAPHAQIESLDLSAGMLKRAAERLSPADRARVRLRQADALSTRYPETAYDAVTTLFFLDCFTAPQVAGLIARLGPALTPDAVWLHADFALPSGGWRRQRAQAWLRILYTFFRWQTGLSARELPPSEALLHAAGWAQVAGAEFSQGLLRSAVFARAPGPPNP